MNTWRCGRSATRSASTARCGSPSRQRARPATATPFVSWAIAVDRLPVAGRGGREAGLDDVHVEPHELARDLQLLGDGERRAGRLLAVTQRGVEDADGALGPRGAGAAGYAGYAHRDAAAPAADSALVPMPVPARPLTSTGSSHAICDAQLGADLLDLVVAVLRRAGAGTPSPPTSISAIHWSAKAPDWMSVRTSFMVALTPSATRGPRHVVAVLGGVADAEAHEVEPAAVHQVDDELELVHRLEVGELGLVAGLHERLEGGLDERRDATAQQRLLPEQVGLGLLLEGRLEHARARRAKAAGVGQDARPGRARGVLLDREQGRHAAARHVHRAQQVAGSLGRDHAHVDVRRGLDAPEPDVEAVGEHQQRAGREVGRDLRVVDLLLDRVRDARS